MSTKNRQPNRRRSYLIAVIAVCAAAIAFTAGYFAAQNSQNSVVQAAGTNSSEDLSVDSEGFGDTVLADGKNYSYNHNLKNILFLGVDKSQQTIAQDIAARNGRSDTMILFLLNSETRTTQMLEISRDTMTDVDVYDANDIFQFTGKMQLTMQYAFSSSAKRGCWLACNKVSELLYGVPIDATISLTMDGIAPIVDELGGVTLTVPEDYTEIDAVFQKGAVLTLSGQQAFQYVHYRSTSASGSNDTRMERQMQFMEALYQKLSRSASGTLLSELQETAGPYLESDLDAESLQELVQYSLSRDVLEVPGATQQGSLHDEYIVDEESLRSLVLSTFYTEIP